MLIAAENSLLLVVDVQERLLPAKLESQAVLRNVAILIRAAGHLGIPVMATEQYPQGLGRTVEAIAGLLPRDCTIEKISFSGIAEPSLGRRIAESGRSHILICGAEAHVCVLQTATVLAGEGYRVYVAADATSL